MPLKRPVLETQKEDADKVLAAIAGDRPAAELRKDPKWRSANARCKQLARRLKRVGQVEQLDSDLAGRRGGAEDSSSEEE